MANEFTARVAGISVELGMSVQNKSGIWCEPTVKMDLKIDGVRTLSRERLSLNRLLMRFVITLRKPSQRWSNTHRGGGESISPLSLTGGNYGKTDKSKRG
ncbi:MAG: hypothetical protein ACLSUN_15155 [Anaerobutyricum soehngenii]